MVYKTPTADLVGQGLSGTADLQTIRPLQQSSRILAGNVRYEWNDLSAVPGSSDDARYNCWLALQNSRETGTALSEPHRIGRCSAVCHTREQYRVPLAPPVDLPFGFL